MFFGQTSPKKILQKPLSFTTLGREDLARLWKN